MVEFTEREQELLITRVFDAPRDDVWLAWADLDRTRQWWGPRDFTVAELEADPRPGGAWRAVMRAPDGTLHPQHGVYQKVVPPELLTFTLMWERDSHAGEMLVSVSFAEQDDRTRMTLRKRPVSSREER